VSPVHDGGRGAALLPTGRRFAVEPGSHEAFGTLDRRGSVRQRYYHKSGRNARFFGSNPTPTPTPGLVGIPTDRTRASRRSPWRWPTRQRRGAGKSTRPENSPSRALLAPISPRRWRIQLKNSTGDVDKSQLSNARRPAEEWFQLGTISRHQAAASGVLLSNTPLPWCWRGLRSNKRTDLFGKETRPDISRSQLPEACEIVACPEASGRQLSCQSGCYLVAGPGSTSRSLAEARAAGA
jgi:hypothetical protein